VFVHNKEVCLGLIKLERETVQARMSICSRQIPFWALADGAQTLLNKRFEEFVIGRGFFHATFSMAHICSTIDVRGLSDLERFVR
jgi:hypothetical protein